MTGCLIWSALPHVYNWTNEQRLLQFAGHLRGRTLHEWNLLDREEKTSYAVATEALCSRLDPGGRALAAQDFCHKYQHENEAVGDFIQRLERTYSRHHENVRVSVPLNGHSTGPRFHITRIKNRKTGCSFPFSEF